MNLRGQRRVLPSSGAVPTFAVAGIVLAAVVLLGVAPTLDPIALLSGDGFKVTVPEVAEQTQPRALLRLEEVPLEGRVTFAHSSSVPRGIVAAQTPKPGTRVGRGSTVRLVVSRGPNQVSVPSVVGEAEGQAKRDLRRVGLVPRVERLNDETVPKGQVVRQSPGPDVVVSGGERVDLVVSLGPFVRPVPDVVGMAVEGAMFTIGKSGLALGELRHADDPNVPEGAVIGTEPIAGTTLERDTPVNVVVSNGPPPVAVPGLVGGKQANAVDQLARIGLIASEVSSFADPGGAEEGTILSQSPAPGTLVRRGQVETLTIARPSLATTTAPPAAGGG